MAVQSRWEWLGLSFEVAFILTQNSLKMYLCDYLSNLKSIFPQISIYLKFLADNNFDQQSLISRSFL